MVLSGFKNNIFQETRIHENDVHFLALPITLAKHFLSFSTTVSSYRRKETGRSCCLEGTPESRFHKILKLKMRNSVFSVSSVHSECSAFMVNEKQHRQWSSDTAIHHGNSVAAAGDKMSFYDTWAENYDQDVAVLDYHAASQAANSISSHFSGDRKVAVVLDVACGTGMVTKRMEQDGFKHFVGIDGSKAMLEVAQKKGLYQDVKQCILGEQLLPVQKASFDVVVIAGSLSVDHVPVSVVRELYDACKPGGYICMTCRHGCDNLEYKAALERELKQMEEERLWSCVENTVVEKWARAVSQTEGGYISGSVYLYKKL